MSQEQQGWMVQASWHFCIGAPSTYPSVGISLTDRIIIKRAKQLTKTINRIVKTCQNLMVISQNCKGVPVKMVEVLMTLQNW